MNTQRNTHNRHIRLLRGAVLAAAMLFSYAGAQAQTPPHVTVGGSVFGGGNAADVSGNSTVLMQGSATVETDVYGGGALANVGSSNSDATTVTIESGNVGGNVYGGGLGNAGTAALVNGVVTVNIGKDNGGSVSGEATIGGAVFGCNNVNGTPRDNVFVNIYKTARTSGTNTVADDGFALSEVFGGGNKAAYLPATTGKKTTVHVYTCDNTIQYVYGGGNAADVGDGTTSSATDVIIDGGRIEWVFGGGNGYSATNNHNNPSAPNYNPGANIYGNATVDYHAGEITYIFGGSNQWGNITGSKSVNILADGSCTKHIHELYGGSNEAPITSGGASLTMGCSAVTCPIDAVYGGSRNANITGDVVLTIEGGSYASIFGGNNIGGTINGNVTLNLLGGTIDTAFGGNNAGGAITGKITVNMLDKGSANCPLTVHNIYGGGKNAAYSPTTPGAYPEVNLIHGSVTKNGDKGGNVYGGGFGAPAIVTSTPTVNVGYDASMAALASTLKGSALTTSTVAVAGNVFGGGEAAPVTGSTTVTLQQVASGVTATTTVSGNVYGGGNLADVSGSTDVNVAGGTVSTDVYGGGALADVGTNGSDHTHVTVSGGTVSGVYGGGLGDDTHEALVNGAVHVTIDGGTVDDVFGCNNVNGRPTSTVRVDINNNVGGDVFGGGNLATYTGDPYVYINKGTVTGNVFGGGNGDPDDNTQMKGSVTGTPHVTVGDLTVGNELYQAIVSGDVYGGGNAAKVVTGTPTVEVLAKCNTQINNVYGGGNAADVPATSVTIDGGTINQVFGGGHGDKDASPSPIAANVAGNTNVTVTGGTINQVFGGSNSNGTIGGTINVDINKANTSCPMVITEVYGGGNYAASNAGNITIGCTGDDASEYIDYVYGGANRADINGDITLNITGGRINNAFGGNNTSGTIDGDITVNVEWGTPACGDNYLGNVYGAGNLAPYSEKTSGHPEVNIKNGTAANVFGGGKGASAVVTGNPVVTIGDANGSHVANVTGRVYGGGDAAAVTGNTTVTYNDNNASSVVDSIFGGGNAAGVSGTATVTLTSGKVSGGLYGGCNTEGTVSGDITVTLTGGTVGVDGTTTDVVYGGGFGHSTATSGDINVTLNGSTVYGNLYGGSALGSVNASDKSTTVTIGGNGLNGKVFGGGMGSGSGASTQATTLGDVVINYNTANSGLAGIYGGANVNGRVVGNISVNVNANVGTSGDGNGRDIFGGGLGAHTSTDGNVTVTLGDNTNTAQPVVFGNIYGGSALGSVNNAEADLTTVNILSGTLHGNAFGGGLGKADAADSGQVNGTIIVNVGETDGALSPSYTGFATIDGSVYGCNNTNGSPQGNVTVNIYKTGHTEGVAITNVFGGGKKANFNASGKKAYVNVFTCDNTIGDLYGGGDAADVPGSAVTIWGGRFDKVFGGGNGAGVGNPGANIGTGGITIAIHGGNIGTLVNASNEKGSIGGSINVTVDNEGGCNEEVDEFFGGSNMVDITGDVNTTIECGAGTFGAVYGGSNKANIIGSVSLTIKGGTIGRVFGGSKGDLSSLGGVHSDVSAGISGNVTLTLNGGTIGAAFGGSNINGTIGGGITVTVMDSNFTNCGLQIDSVFGAGNLTPYKGSPVVNINHGTVGHGNVDGVVFGGGKGATAVVTGSPVVTIGDNTAAHRTIVTGSVFGGGDAAAVTGNTTVTYNDNNANSSYVGNIYGGGNAAGIDGNTQVTLTRGRVLDGIYGGCNTSGTVTGNSTVDLLGGQVGTSSNSAVVFGGGYGQATNIDGNVLVTMGNIAGTANPVLYADIYGGSALGNVNTKSSNVNVDTKVNNTNTTTLDILSGVLDGNIYGGGLGQRSPSAIAPLVHGMVQINIGRNTGNNESPEYTGFANLQNADIYGCNNVNGSPQNDVHIDVYATAHPTGTLVDDTLSHRSYAIANLYGGGNAADYAPENGLASSSKKTYVHVYGCENTIGELFGGGNAAAVVGDSVYIEGGRFNEIFGGGNGAVTAANVGLGGIHLNARSGRVGYIFEQCNKRGRVDGITKYYHGGGDCNNGILQVDYYFCGGNIQDIFGDSVYVFTCSDKVRYMALYGGCRLGRHYGNIRLEIEGGTIGEVYGGSQGMDGYSADVRKYPRIEDVVGHEADYPTGIKDTLIKYPELQGTGGNVTVIIKGGTIGSVFGGCNVNGNVEGSITVIIDSAESDACPLDLDYVYGGGNFARYVPTTVANFNYPYIQLKKGHVNHNVYGGGHGSTTDVDAGRVESNPHIVMDPADGKFWVKGNIYGGGEMGSVGQYTRDGSGKPTACAANTGHTTIEISAGRVGPAVLKMPDYSGHVFGGSKGAVGDTTSVTGNPKLCHIAYVNTSDVTISGTAFIKGSVYGGGESGRIFDSTYVKIQGGQIGCGWNADAATDEQRDLNRVYTDAEWLYDVTSDNTKFLYECNHWPFGNPSTGKYDPYDPYEHPQAYDGHTFYGNVFGGGSGMMPYKSRNIADNADSSLYIQSAGRVLGTTRVEVTGGHILTNIYGGCELGDILDACTVNFGGTATLGVPRTLAQIAAHPVTCYLFGAGKGDERVRFNTRTNVENVHVKVDGGRIYGSVFGGGEDGHVMRNVLMDIKPGAKIGTWGTSYVDGNVFGGGRGFSGNALTAGNVAGDITVNITGGTMLGSIYGGGRLASVGYGLYPDTDPRYGVMRPDNEDDAGNTVAGFSRGHITVNISGNTVIGNDVASDYSLPHSRGGNVFGGSMGRLTKLDGTMVLPLWHRLGCAKATTVNIGGNVHVKGNVYGGSELGRVTDSITVNISGNNVIVGRNAAGSYGHGNVYGGGMGHTLTAAQRTQVGNDATSDSIPTFAGLTGGTIKVNISGGAINNNVYGAGELASVGTIATVTKHEDPNTSYFLSWPYEYTYNGNSGDARVNITGGTIGFINGSDTTGGNIYGSARGIVGDRYVTGRLATARVTHVDINLTNPGDKIIGDVYGSGENGHVYDSAVVTLRNGLVLGNVFGGGKGTDTYTDQLKDPSDDHLYNATVYDIIAGKVFGNTKVNILGGRVAKNVYGGGNMASVGIGNYKGYGEATNVSQADSLLAENSGHCYVTILGGIIGPDSLSDGTRYNGNYAVTTGHVYGAGKGIVFPTAKKVGFDYDRDYYVAYVNKTFVIIGDSTNRSCQYTSSDPHVTGIVFGGGENGHTRFDTYIQTNRGQIGVRPLDATGKLTSDVGHWNNRGNIFGAGRGEDMLPNGKYCQSAGSVTRNTRIDVLGARIYRNVQGGGAMASVGPIKGRGGETSTCVINVDLPSATDTLGGPSNTNNAFGGYIGGGSRGIPSPDGTRNDSLATCHNSQINIYQGRLKNTIYGGGENGQMLGNTQINVYGGYIRSAIYGGGKGSWKETPDTINSIIYTYTNDTLSGYIAGNTTVNLLGGQVPFTYGGCRRANVGGNATINIGEVKDDGSYSGEASFIVGKDKVYGGNQYAGSPRGNIYVNVYKTAHTAKDAADYTGADATYAINYVYGGSYNSPYLPNKSGHYAQVHVYGCDNTINEVYGGCSAANVGAKPGIGANTKLIIDGGRFNNVYGGGDGTYDHYLRTSVPANIYGAAITEIHGGTIGSLFGGSNFMGQADTISISVDNESGCGNVEGDEFFGGSNLSNLGTPGNPTNLITTLGCGVKFRAAYGGSNKADIIGDVTLIIKGGQYDEVYAGSKGAIVAASASDGMKDTVKSDITGNTHLIVRGGKVHSAFGGSNINGNITGTITVDIDSTYDNCDWDVDYVYGGSNLTQYIPDDTTVTNYTYSPKVNIIQGTVDTNVFGGGRGSKDNKLDGLVKSNSQVNVSGGQVKGNVYGGGEMASIDGDAYVNVSGTALIGYDKAITINGGDSLSFVYGGGKGKGDDPLVSYNDFADVRNTYVNVSGGQVSGSVFGGAEDGHVLGNTDVRLSGSNVIGSGGYEHELDGCVLGAGRNSNNIHRGAGRVAGHTNVTVTGGRIRRSVFGGGSLARVGVDANGSVASFMTEHAKKKGQPTVDSTDANGNFIPAYDSLNHGSTFVDVSGDTVQYANAAAFEASEYYATYKTTTRTYGDGKVTLYLTTIGGPDNATLVDNAYTIGDIFGGGKGDTKDTVDIFAGRVMNTHVKVHGSPRIMADIYAGGEMSCIGWYDTTRTNPNRDNYYDHTGYTHVTISDSPYGGSPYEFSSECIHGGRPWTLVDAHGRLYHTCSGNVYGGGQGYVELGATHRHNWVQMGRVRETDVIINGGRFLGNVFGGGSRGFVKGDCHVTVTGGHFGCVINDPSNNLGDKRYYYGSIFGGGYGNHKTFSHKNDSCFVKLNGDTVEAMPIEMAGRVYGNTYVNVSGGTIMHSIYGGGDMASTGWVERNPSTGDYYYDTPAKRHGGVCTVKITGTTILGPLDSTGHNAYVYGAGKGIPSDPTDQFKHCANVNETHLTINLGPTGRIWGSSFGGGADAHVLGDVETQYHGGTMGTRGITSYDGNIFGAGRNYLNSNHTNGRVQGNIKILMDGGAIKGTIFGGGRLALSGVDSVGHFIDASHGNVNIWVSGNASIGTTHADSLLFADETCGDIFGSGKGDVKNYEDIWAGRVTNAKITVKDTVISENTYSPRIYGSIFGGGEMASLGWWNDTIKDGNDIVFSTRGDDAITDIGKMYTGTGDATITISGNVLVGTSLEYTVDPDENPGDWTIYSDDKDSLIHTCTGNVYGGGQGDIDPSTPRWVSMGRSASATVTISGGTFMGNIFGGGEQSVMTGNATITISGGTFGIDGIDTITPFTDLKYNSGDIYGAGYGCDVLADNAATWEDEEGVTHPNVNDSTGLRSGLPDMPADLAGRVYGNTRVNILGGHIYGDIYGGGSFASVGYEKSGKTAGVRVNGNTRVNIGAAGPTGSGATIDGSVFGANNYSGSPFGNTEVNIYRTAHTPGDPLVYDPEGANVTVVTGNSYPSGLRAVADEVDELDDADMTALSGPQHVSLSQASRFALTAVYGGGNKAAHTPLTASGTTDNDGTTLVHVWYCDENTICNLYGGGNAASTVNNHVIVDGGRLRSVFGGGNGFSATINHENPNAPNYNPGADVSGIAITEIHGGIIDSVYAGSNQFGDVANVNLVMDNSPEEGDACEELIANTFGGGNEAGTGGGTYTLSCGVRYDNFYAGANNADIGSQALWDAGTPTNIVLNIEGGTYVNVFGGNNQGGTIWGNVIINYHGGNIQNLYGGSYNDGSVKGFIEVNVDVDPDYSCADGLRLDRIYGGGYNAPYTPYDPFAASPRVNIKNNRFKSGSDSLFVGIRDVYGGGYGATAEVTGFPRVVIGGFGDTTVTITPDDPETVEVDEAVTKTYSRAARIFKNVYGGGNASPVNGNPAVIIRNAVIGPGNGSDATDQEVGGDGTVYGGGYGATSKVTGNTYVAIHGLSDIKNNVYGGGNAGVVTGNTHVEMGYLLPVLPPEIVATPVFDGSGNVTAVNATFRINGMDNTGITFYHTTDGSRPDTLASKPGYVGSTVVGNTPFEITFGAPVRCIATKAGYMPSVMMNVTAPAPDIVYDSGTRKVSFDATVGTRIYYTTDGSTPTTSSTLYGAVGEADGTPFSADPGTTVKAIAQMRGCANSPVVSFTVP